MNRKKRKKKRKDSFWKYYKLYTISLSILVIFGLIVLWFSLVHYEKEHPYRVTIDFGPADTKTDEELVSSTTLQGYTVKAPSSLTIIVDGNELTSDACINSSEIDELSFIDTITERFSEYNNMKDMITIPTMEEYYINSTIDEITGISWHNIELKPEFDADTACYQFPLPDDNTLREECSDFALSFAKDYATFCANDASSSTLQPYFPSNSEYLRLISSVDNKYNAHSNLNFSNETITEFTAYSKNLAFIHVELDENMKLKSTGADFTYHVSLPIYIAKLDGKWVIINIE